MKILASLLLIAALPLWFLAPAAAPAPTASAAQTLYRCTPCGYGCDTVSYDKGGACPACAMPLVDAATIVFKTVEAAALCDYIGSHPDVVLLDVRTKEEFEGRANPDFGRLKGAVNIPVQELAKRLPEISSFKKKEMIVYCSHSHRSPQASYLLTQAGFANVTNMAGGMSVLKRGPCKY